jgi:transcriptional regulator with XRE-family HTH domain
MKEISKQDLQCAIGCVKSIFNRRGWNQTQLARYSNVPQPTISKIFDGKADGSVEVLRKLCQALGVKLNDILDIKEPVHDICGYLATPLTGITAGMEAELERTVEAIKAIAGDFSDPKIGLYWPGEYTHPLKNSDLSAETVYLMDRSRASSHDFVLLFCASTSYGVGQENEIATQAGMPAIRLVPAKLSRMMKGSFLRATDVPFEGTLETKIKFDAAELRSAFENVRSLYFRHHGVYRTLNGGGFGERLTKLVNERSGGYALFSEELGISLPYLQTLMEEHLVISNPSAQLLRRMALRLGTTVGYLLGEAGETDPTWIESQASWKRWIDNDPTIPAGSAVALQDEWLHEYRLAQNQQSTASFRKSKGPVTESDWQERYMRKTKRGKANGTGQLFK